MGRSLRFNPPTNELLKLQPHFQLNLDKTCVMGNLSNLRIVGSAEVKKHEKASSDNKESITIVQIGLAADDSGPWIFLIKKKGSLDKNNPLCNLKKNFLQVPVDSTGIPTPNAYMTNDVWCELAPIIANEI